jgi:hypothetical protein
VLSNFEDASHDRKVWQLRRAIRNERGAAPIPRRRATVKAVRTGRAHLTASFDASKPATLDELEPLVYVRPIDGLPAHVRAASALRRFENRLIVVQDDVLAFAARDESGAVEAVLLPSHESGQRVFDDTLGNKHEKLDLEACVTLPDGRLVAFGSGSAPARERLVVFSRGEEPVVVAAASFYRELRAAVTRGGTRLNIEGAVVRGARLELMHRGNDARASSANAIAEVEHDAFAAWLEGDSRSPRVARVTTVDLGAVAGVPFGFTDAVALDDERLLVLACAEDTACAVSDGAVLGCRVGLLDGSGLTTADVHDAAGPTLLKLEGIERRSSSSTEFDVVADVDRPSVPAQLGRLVWDWR